MLVIFYIKTKLVITYEQFENFPSEDIDYYFKLNFNIVYILSTTCLR